MTNSQFTRNGDDGDATITNGDDTHSGGGPHHAPCSTAPIIGHRFILLPHEKTDYFIGMDSKISPPRMPSQPLLSHITAALVLSLLLWMLYSIVFAPRPPGDLAYQTASRFFSDGDYAQALTHYERALQENPSHWAALRGKAESLILLHRESEAVLIYDQLIALKPDKAGYYANRGIAHDRLGHYDQALADYLYALQLDQDIGAGPNWWTRFLRGQSQPLPGIADRARYLQSQLALPIEQRVLRLPEQDAMQRPYSK